MAKKTETEAPASIEPVVPEPAERLAPFLDIIASGEVPYVRIAELADVTVADVEAFVLALEPDRVEPKIEPPTSTAAQPTAEPTTEPTERLAPDPVSAPHSVRCVRKARILDPTGRPWRIGTRDVYSGPLAEFLWERHRQLVEAFPLRPG